MKPWAKQKGFTIVELLIVIVVIGILAAISIVAYNGIQNRAKYSAAQSLASNIVKKVEAFNAVYGRYPSVDELRYNRAAGSSIDNSGPPEAKVEPNSVIYATAATGTTTAFYSPACTGNTGAFIDYWDYNNNRITSSVTTPRSYVLGKAPGC